MKTILGRVRVNLLYNFFGVTILYGILFLCRLPILWAQSLAAVASERKSLVFAYIFGMFFVIPGILLGATAIFS